MIPIPASPSFPSRLFIVLDPPSRHGSNNCLPHPPLDDITTVNNAHPVLALTSINTPSLPCNTKPSCCEDGQSKLQASPNTSNPSAGVFLPLSVLKFHHRLARRLSDASRSPLISCAPCAPSPSHKLPVLLARLACADCRASFDPHSALLPACLPALDWISEDDNF